MEFFTDDDIALVHSSGDKEVEPITHKKLVEVYKKLEHLCKLIKGEGFEYEIRKDPRSQGGWFELKELK